MGVAGGGRALAEGISKVPSLAPKTLNPIKIFKYEKSAGYDPAYPNGSRLKWWASGPTPAHGGFSAATISSGIATISSEKNTLK